MLSFVKFVSDLNMLVVNNKFIGNNKYEVVLKRNSYEDENWYMVGIFRFVIFNVFFNKMLLVFLVNFF